MKRRALSLALVLCLLLSLLSMIPSTAEEAPLEADARSEEIEDFAQEPPTEELPEPELPAPTGLTPPPEEETPEEEAPEAEMPGEEMPEEQPSADDPSGEQPAEEQPAEEQPGEESDFEEQAIESEDFGAYPALGSDDVQYAGVVYLSRAAYERMDEDARESYVEMVDDLTGLLDRGVVVNSPVFSLDEEGTPSFDCILEMEPCYESAEVPEPMKPIEQPEEVPEPVEAESPEAEEPVAEEGPELAGEEAEISKEEAALSEEEAIAEEESVAENVELAEQLRIPRERVSGMPSRATASNSHSIAMERFDSLYWDGKPYFYNQLSAAAKLHFKAAEQQMIADHYTGYVVFVPSGSSGSSAMYDALSALMMTYPAAFDWAPPTAPLHFSSSYINGGYRYTAVLDLSPHYSASLEKQAQAKVNSLVNSALSYAKSKYPNDLDYGMMYYFDDWLCANNTYNMVGTDSSQQNTATYYYCHTSYGVLLKGSGVCESYALALSRLMDAAGIPNMYAEGDAYKANGSYSGRHAWNYVFMSGKYYLQDTTWNDPASASAKSYRTYLLRANDSRHVPDGRHYGSQKFSFPAISTSKYSPRTAAAKPTARLKMTPLPTSSPSPSPSPTPTVRPNTPTPRPVTPCPATTRPATPRPATPTPTRPNTPTPRPATPTPTRPNTPTPTARPNPATPEPEYEEITSELCLAKGKSATVEVYDPYLLFFRQSWKSSDPKIAKVNGSGKVTGVKPGSATISLTAGGYTARCTVYVYQISGITFDENGKSALTASGGAQEFTLRVKQKNRLLSAERLQRADSLDGLRVTSSKPRVASASATVSGDAIRLRVTPGEAGDSVIKLSFGGKSAKLTYQVRRPIQSDWFELSGLSNGVAYYTGKAIKPKVLPTGSAPSNVKYKVKYLNNKRVGTATVRITGSGAYGGTVERSFQIEPSPAGGALRITAPKAKTYNGSPQSAGITVKLGKRKLKAGVDYQILYDGSPTPPTNAGSYDITLRGISVSGPLTDGRSLVFTIKSVPITKLKISLRKTSVKYSGFPVTAAALGMKLKYGSKVLPASDYQVYYVYGGRWMEYEPPVSPGSYYVLAAPVSRNISVPGRVNCVIKGFKIKK